MGEEDDFGALAGQFEYRRRHALDTGRVGNLAVFDRHIEVDAHEHALAGDVGEIVEGFEGCRREYPILFVPQSAPTILRMIRDARRSGVVFAGIGIG